MHLPGVFGVVSAELGHACVCVCKHLLADKRGYVRLINRSVGAAIVVEVVVEDCINIRAEDPKRENIEESSFILVWVKPTVESFQPKMNALVLCVLLDRVSTVRSDFYVIGLRVRVEKGTPRIAGVVSIEECNIAETLFRKHALGFALLVGKAFGRYYL